MPSSTSENATSEYIDDPLRNFDVTLLFFGSNSAIVLTVSERGIKAVHVSVKSHRTIEVVNTGITVTPIEHVAVAANPMPECLT